MSRFYFIHLSNIRQTLDESKTVVTAQDYYAYGETLREYNNGQANDKYKFTEKERDAETNLDAFGARYYDSKLGIWYQVDPLGEGNPGYSPYSYTYDNPLIYRDPDGRAGWIVGALIGAATDIAVQMVVEGKSASDINWKSVGVSAVTGAVGAGLASKIDKLGKFAKFAAEAAIDAGGSAASQLEANGKVDAGEVVVDVAIGRTVGALADKLTGKTKVSLEGDADRKGRIASNGDNRSASSQARKDSKAEAAKKELEKYVGKTAAASNSASQTGSSILKKANNKNEDKEKTR